MMTVQKDPNQTTTVVRDQKAIAGVDKYLGNAANVQLQGKTYTPAAIKAALQAEIDANRSLDLARSAVRQQVADTKPVRASARGMRSALRKYVLSTYGAYAVQVFEDFGFNVPKSLGPQTAEAKAKSAVKAKATRDAKKAALEKVQPGGQPTQPTTPQK
jgi:hypothetical protein